MWAAGFLDGEGCFSLLDAPSLSVTQKYRGPLDELARMFGGRVRPLKGRGWQWAIHSETLRAALPVLIPYLRLKRRQAEILMEYSATARHGQNRISAEVRELRTRLIDEHAEARRAA